MKKVRLALAIAGVVGLSTTVHAQFGGAVLSYNSGSGFAAGFTNASAALGAPTSGSGVTPFAPPFSKNQIVSIGSGGELTLQLTTPIVNDPSHPFGLDFIIFGNTFFVLSGSAATGALGGNNTGSTLVEVSADDVNWFTLNPALAPTVDGLFPTDGTGNPQLPADPTLTASGFAGQNLAGIRSLYGGSAGGTGFDLAWAVDGSGNSVDLQSADFVRIDVSSGKSEVDAVSAVPEPSSLALILTGVLFLWFRLNKQKSQRIGIMRIHLILLSGLLIASSAKAATITENFTSDPLQNGWKIFGETNLFRWDSTNHNLVVTWDSSHTNSYFYHPLGTIIARDDDFAIAFDLRLNDIISGNEPGKTGPLEIGIGFFNFGDATNAAFGRGIYGGSPNIAEFDYFPAGYYDDSSGGIFAVTPTTTPTFISSGGFSYAPTAFTPYEFEIPTNLWVHVAMTYTATNQTLATALTTNGTLFVQLPDVVLTNASSSGFSDSDDFRVNTFSISSYSSVGDDYDSVLAHGEVANVAVTVPPPPAQNLAGAFSNGVWQVQFTDRTNWFYTLERSSDFQNWTDASATTPGADTNLFLQDTNPPGEKVFYRVRASRP